MSEEKAPFTVGEQGDAQPRSETGNKVDEKQLLEKIGEMMDAKFGEKLNEWGRQQQAHRSRTASILRKETEAQIKSLQAIGITPTEDQVQTIRKEIQKRIDEDLEVEETKPDNRPEPQRQQAQQNNQPIEDYVAAMKEEYGIVVNRGDPEAEMVDTSSLTAFYRTYKKAVEAAAKKANTPAQARIPAPAGAGAASPTEESYRNEILAARGQPAKIREIQDRYRKAGVAIEQVRLFSR